jgi:hypothetical protein
MGHSAGGAFVQLLLDRGHGAVGVAINSAPTEGVRVGRGARYPPAVDRSRCTRRATSAVHPV